MQEQKYIDQNGLVYYDRKLKKYINNTSKRTLKAGGSIRFIDLPHPSFENVNYLYEILDDFTTNEYFDTPGNVYKAGTIVQVSNIDDVYLYTIFQKILVSQLEMVDEKVSKLEDEAVTESTELILDCGSVT